MDATPYPITRQKHVEDEYPEDQGRKDRNAKWSRALDKKKQAADQASPRNQRINYAALAHGINQSLRGFVFLRDSPRPVQEVVQEPGATHVDVVLLQA